MTRRLVVLSSAVAAVAALVAPAAGFAATNVSGSINADTTWTTAGSPYLLLTDVTVAAGVTLTIQPGVVVKPSVSGSGTGGKDGGRIEFTVNGTLKADASGGSAIVFQSDKASPAAGDWYGVVFSSSSLASVVRNVEIAHAWRALTVESTTAANLVADGLNLHHFTDSGAFLTGSGTTVALANVEAYAGGASSNCVYLNGPASATHTGLKLHGCATGLYVSATNLVLRDSLIYGNTTQGVYLYRTDAAANHDVRNSTIWGNGSYGFTIYRSSSYGSSLTVTDSVVAGHTAYAFYGSNSSYYPTVSYNYCDVWNNGSTLGSYLYTGTTTGSLSENPLFKNPATGDFTPTERSPLRFSDSTATNPRGTIGLLDYAGDATPGYQGVYWAGATFPAGTVDVEGDITVPAGATLTVPAGTTLRFATTDGMAGGQVANKVELMVRGTLALNGTPASQVVLVSAGSGTTDWQGVHVFPSAEGLTMTAVKVQNAVYGLWLEATNLAPADLEAASCDTGVYASGNAAPQLSNLTIHDCRIGLRLSQSKADASAFSAYNCGSYGVRVEDGAGEKNRFTTCKVYDNTTGFSLAASGAAATVELDHCTVAFNRGDAFSLSRNSSYGVNLTLAASAVTDNTGYGFNGTNSSYYSTVTWSYSDVWNNGNGPYNSYLYPTAGGGAIVYNPLYAGVAARNFKPTHRSPLRKSDGAGGDIGAETYGSDVTPGVQGVYWESASLAGGTVDAEGDLIVAAGATLTVPAGTTLRFPAGADAMGGGQASNKGELVVRGTLVASGSAVTPILLTSTGTGQSDWYGVHLVPSAEGLTMTGVKVQNAAYGLWLETTNLVPADLEAANCDTGVYANGNAAPQLANLALHDCRIGLRLSQSKADATAFSVYNCSAYGVRVEDGAGEKNRFATCKVYDNTMAFSLAASGAGATVELDHCTVAFNRGDAFGLSRNSSYGVNLALTASVVTDNAGYAFNGTNSSYYSTVAWSYTDVWNNANGPYNSYLYPTASAGSFVYNPLYANAGARDFKPTHRSPLRYSDGSDHEIGAEAFGGDQTPGYQGFYWANYQFGSGTYDIEGDIVITARKIPGSGVNPTDPADDVPAKVTFVPGVTLRMATTDAMGGGRDAGKIEIVNHGLLEMDGISFLPVKATSAAASPTNSDWYGVVIASDAFGTNVSEAELSYGQYCVRVEQNAHLVKNLEAHHCRYGVFVTGGSPEVRGVNLHDDQVGLYIENSATRVFDLVSHKNTSYGVQIEQTDGSNRTIPVSGCQVNHNANHGLQLRASSGTLNVDLDRCTVHGNGAQGANLDRNSSAGVTLDFTNSSLTGNALYGVNGTNSSYYSTVTAANTDIWGNASGVSNSYLYYTAGTGVFSYNPLYKDPANEDFTPTDRSPLRCAHQDGAQAAGYKAYVGDPTGKVVGYLHGDMTLTAAGSPWVIPGDLVVDNKCSATPATLTIEPGAVVQFAAGADLMGGGANAGKAELRVVDKLVLGGAAAQAQLVSGAAAPAKGDWTGVVLDGGSSVLANNFLVEWADSGFQGASPAGNQWTRGVVRNCSSYGYHLTSGADPLIQDGLVTLNGTTGVRLVGLTGNPTLKRTILLDNGSIDVEAYNSGARLINNVLMGSTHGFSVTRTSSASATLYVDLYNNTIHEHAGDCIRTNTNVSGSGGIYLQGRNNLMTWCKGYAFDDANSSYRIYIPANGFDYNDTWQTNGYYNLTKPAHDLNVDPLYEDIDPSGKRRWYDLRLLSNSSLLNVGAAWTTGSLIPQDDLLGVARPKLSGWDIGAYEYDPAANHDPWAAAGADLLVAMLDVTCFDASATTDPDGDPMTYQWSFGDGDTASGKLVCHTFRNNVIHEVILTVLDNRGGVDHDVVLVDVDKRPVAEAGPEVYAAAGGDAAAFDGTQSYDQDGTVVAYLWDFGDGTTSTLATPTHQYAPGPSKDVLVTLTVTDNDGFSSSDTTIAHVIGTTDTNGPLIVHSPIANGRPEGQALDVAATISDPSGVKGAKVYYRATGGTTWSTVAMTLLGGTSWKATIPAAAVVPPGVDYYIEATDNYAPPNVGTLPAPAPSTFLSFTVSAVDLVGPSITHVPVANGQPEGVAVPVSATVTDPSGIASVKLFYRVGGGSTFGSVSMTTTGDGAYKADIPAVVVTSAGVDYYVEATDLAPAGNVSRSPAAAPTTPYHFSVNVSDTTGPTITHTPVPNGQVEKVPVTILADVADSSGVQTVLLSYKVATDPGAYTSVPMTLVSGTQYTATIPGALVTTAGIKYYLYAQDNSAAHNASVAPATAPATPYQFTVTTADTSGPSIAHTPVADGQTVGQAVSINAGVVDSSGVTSVTLYYRVAGVTTWTVQAMTHGAGDAWAGMIPADAVTAAGVQYYLRAVDSSANANASVAPATAPGTPYQFTARVLDTTGPDVTHTPIRNGQLAGTPVVVTATVTDPSGVNSVTLYYRTGTGGAFTIVSMSTTGGGTYTASIPGAAVAVPSVDYYLVAVDGSAAQNQTFVPASAPGTPLTFTVTPQDTAGPVITHTPVTDGQLQGVAVAISATVTDSSGLASVDLFYRSAGAATWTSAAMSAGLAGQFVGQIPAGAVTGSAMEYYLRATDASPAANVSVLPTTAPATPFAFTLVAPDTAGPVIDHVAVADGRPAGQAVAIAATVTDAGTGVGGVKLYFRAHGDVSYAVVDLANSTGNTWEGSIPAFAVTVAGVDYYLRAQDKASTPNVTLAPATAPGTPYAFTVVAADTTGPLLAHLPVSDGQPAGVAVPVAVSASDASGIASVVLRYRVQGDAGWTTVGMTDGNGDGVYDASIPGAAVTPAGVEYYLTATDASAAANASTLPVTAPTTPFRFTVVTRDTTAPGIVHTPVANGQPSGATVAVQASITDASGVLAATLYYRKVGDSSWQSVAMAPAGGDTWGAAIPGASVTTAGVQYYLEATDKASPANIAVAPATGPAAPYAFTVTATDTSGPSISPTPVANGQPAGKDVAIQATVVDPSGVATVTLFWRTQGVASWLQAAMTSAGGGSWTGVIPGASVQVPGVDWYLEATDASPSANAARAPVSAPIMPFPFTVVAPDTTPPTVTHTAIADGQPVGADVAVQAYVVDASGVASVTLRYRVGSSGAFSAVDLDDGDGDGTWTGTIPGWAVTASGVEYYLTAVDKAPAANVAVLPTTAPATPFRFTGVARDTAGPTIQHVPVADGRSAGADVVIEATVTDGSGVGQVTLHFRPQGQAWATAALAEGAGGMWAGTIPGYAVTAAGVEYWLEATDLAVPSNTSVSPAGAPGTPYRFTVLVADTSGPTISVAPVAAGQVPGKDVAVQATVLDPSGVASVTLWFRTTGGTVFTSAAMSAAGGGVWVGTIAGSAVQVPGVEFYLEAVDAAAGANGSRSPADAPGSLHAFPVVAPDATPPTLNHTAVADGQLAGAEVPIQALSADASGVASVTLRFRAGPSGAFSAVDLADPDGDGLWTGAIPGYAVTTVGVDYYLTAVDKAPAANAAVLPVTAPATPFRFTVVVKDADGPTIDHTPVADGQTLGMAVPITATITDASGVASARLHFRPAGSDAFAVASLTAQGGNEWTGAIPAYAVTAAGVEYWLEATDASAQANTATDPAGAPASVHAFTVAALDTTGPTIDHTPLGDGQKAGEALTVAAVVQDPAGVASVTLFYRAKGAGSWTDVAMAAQGQVWSASIPGEDVVAPGMEYYLEAVDGATPANTTLDPVEGSVLPHHFTVTVEDRAGPTLAVEAVPGDRPRNKAVTVQATAADPSGIEAVTLFHRQKGETGWQPVPMASLGGDGWAGTIPGEAVDGEAVEYYVRATDQAPTQNGTVWPETAPDQPASFTVAAAADTTGPAITLVPIADGQPAGGAVTVSATVEDPSGVASVTLYYRTAGADAFTSAAMAAGAEAGSWQAVIPASAVVLPAVEYYVEATDGAATPNASVAPAGAPAAPASFEVIPVAGDDVTGPTLTHTLPESLPEGQAFEVRVMADDPSGVASVVLHYTPAGGSAKTLAMEVGNDDATWSATIPAADLVPGSLTYWFEATDRSAAGNASTLPTDGAAGPFQVPVVAKKSGGGGCAAGPIPGGGLWVLLAVAGLWARRRWSR